MAPKHPNVPQNRPTAAVSLASLPYNVLDWVLALACPKDYPALSQTNRMLHHKVLGLIYQNIIIIDSDIETSDTVVRVEKLAAFSASLTPFTFLFISRILIHSQLALQQHDYRPLYDRIDALWDSQNHPIRLVNYDINNVRHSQLFNSYIHKSSLSYVEDDGSCEWAPTSPKVSNLRNWIILDWQEILRMPPNAYLDSLDVFIERQSYGVGAREPLSKSAVDNLCRLKCLYLDLPLSTAAFVASMGETDVRLRLQKLLLTVSHSHRQDSLLLFETLNSLVDVNGLRELELKANCALSYCPEGCLVAFFRDWFRHNSQKNCFLALRKLVLINYKSHSGATNLTQLNTLIEECVFSPQFEQLEEVYLNINDFTKLEVGQTAQQLLDLKKVFQNMALLPSLSRVVIPDFFQNWVRSLPLFLGESDRNYVDLLTNQCFCSQCEKTRIKFNRFSRYDAANNYAHRFENMDETGDFSARINANDKASVRFLSYVIAQLKKQFVYMHQNLFLINLMLNTDDKPFVRDSTLEEYNALFFHSCLHRLVPFFQRALATMEGVNLGGILVELGMKVDVEMEHMELVEEQR